MLPHLRARPHYVGESWCLENHVHSPQDASRAEDAMRVSLICHLCPLREVKQGLSMDGFRLSRSSYLMHTSGAVVKYCFEISSFLEQYLLHYISPKPLIGVVGKTCADHKAG